MSGEEGAATSEAMHGEQRQCVSSSRGLEGAEWAVSTCKWLGGDQRDQKILQERF